MSWRVVFQMRGTDEVEQMVAGALDAYNLAAALNIGDCYGICVAWTDVETWARQTGRL